MRKKKTPTYSVSGSLSGENPYIWLLAVDLNHEPSDVEHRCFLRKTRPICPCSLQNWALFVHPVQYVQVFHPICTQSAPKSGKATRFRSMFHCIKLIRILVWASQSLRECLKTCQNRNGWANLLDAQITTNLPNRPE